MPAAKRSFYQSRFGIARKARDLFFGNKNMLSKIDIAENLLPDADPLRVQIHNEIHARPQVPINFPAFILYVAVLNDEVTHAQELEHLRQLPRQNDLQISALTNNFFRIDLDGYAVKWERHTEFTRYSIVQELPTDVSLGVTEPDLSHLLITPSGWLRSIPGKLIAAIEMAIIPGDLATADATLLQAQHWMGSEAVVASVMGNSCHSWAIADFVVRPSGFERMLIITSPGTTSARAGRISQRLLELETYRLMALRGLPTAKCLAPVLTQSELALAEITTLLESKSMSDEDLLAALISLAASIERSTADHIYRFSATRAYDRLVRQRIAELREKPIPGIQTIGEFMQRRLSPAMSTVSSTEQRLVSLSERVSRASALLRTRVDIASELQNQKLLEKLTRGQELQLNLQTMVEGLSIAAISYYVISLLAYCLKSLKVLGLQVNPDVATGMSIPFVIWGVWLATQRIHRKLNRHDFHNQE